MRKKRDPRKQGVLFSLMVFAYVLMILAIGIKLFSYWFDIY